ncbi:unnamed protein product [Cuscuta europaea]|uniref:BED-type domain-containing protein n=1 Tax=Cuscuta europaea TaxID=41803 RepID=A0A9P0YLH5_CUSEU|nr:unnamed protein product [Cuscuta europaea]
MDPEECVTFSTSGSQPPLSQETVVESQIPEPNITNEQTAPPAVSGQKRKVVHKISKIWDHFDEIKDEKGVVIKGRCIYCAKIYGCHSKKHGTSSIMYYLLIMNLLVYIS